MAAEQAQYPKEYAALLEYLATSGYEPRGSRRGTWWSITPCPNHPNGTVTVWTAFNGKMRCNDIENHCDHQTLINSLGLQRFFPAMDAERLPPAKVKKPKKSKPPRARDLLADTLKTYRKWLYLADDAPVLVTAATVVANNAEGDPLWLLLVGPPSSGKTEALQGIAGLPYVHGAATVTPASLLSGTSPKERAKDATGGLLRQVGAYGILLCKDFTSVLSQNKDTAAEALAALREIYDGNWDRPVGSAGGQVLKWQGKCGLIGGVTPSIDRFGQVVGALGDRYILLRLPDVSPEDQARAALAQGSDQRRMRAELAEAMTRLINGADLDKVGRPLESGEIDRLTALATFTARARTAVERNGYTGEIQVLPQPEGPARIVGQFRRLMGGLEAIGVDEGTRWAVLSRVAVDCVPRIRTQTMRALLKSPVPMGTGEAAKALGVDWKTAGRHLEDLRLLDLASMDVQESSGFDGKPKYLWAATSWLRERCPLEEKYPTPRMGIGNRKDDQGNETALPAPPYSSSNGATSKDGTPPAPTCPDCGGPRWAVSGECRRGCAGVSR